MNSKVDLTDDESIDFFLDYSGSDLEFELECYWAGCCSAGTASRTVVVTKTKARELLVLLQRYVDE